METLILSVLARALIAATPLLLATTGEIIAERAGVLNLGVEGMLALGAVTAFIVTKSTGNALLGAAGFAPVYPEAPLDSADLARVSQAVRRLLEHQEPFPAVLLDRRWNVLQTNRAAPRLFGHFVDLASLPEPRNLLRSMFDPAGLRPWIGNWDEVARTLVRRVYQEAVAGVPDPRVLTLLEELRGFPGSPEPDLGGGELPFHPVEFRKEGLRLRFFSMVTTVGAPRDVTAQELRIEGFFPVDEATERFAREKLA